MDGPLVNYKDKGSSLELVGKEKLNGRDVYNLTITLKEGQVRNIYLDARTFLEVKETAQRDRQHEEQRDEGGADHGATTSTTNTAGSQSSASVSSASGSIGG